MSEWLNCPICGSPDTRAEPEGDEGGKLYYCTNLSCGSNGGGNFNCAADRIGAADAETARKREGDAMTDEQLRGVFEAWLRTHTTEAEKDFASRYYGDKRVAAKAFYAGYHLRDLECGEAQGCGAMIEEKHLVEMLRSMSKKTSQRKVAQGIGVSPQYLGDILHGRRPVSDVVAYALGYRRRVVFEPDTRAGAADQQTGAKREDGSKWADEVANG